MARTKVILMDVGRGGLPWAISATSHSAPGCYEASACPGRCFIGTPIKIVLE
jgi:hypothetical protein